VRSPSTATGEPGTDDDDPFALFGDVGPQLGLLLLLAAIAVMVVWVSRRAGRARATTGRGRSRRRPDWADPHWRARVERLQASPTAIAEATAGDVCVIATLVSAPLSLGGPPERACVWRNQMGADATTAIAADLVFVADDSGRAALEQLEHARVIAPPESAPERGLTARSGDRRPGERARRMVALYLGDKVEICGRFDIDRAGDEADPRNLVYGSLGALGALEIRVIERPEPAPAPAPTLDADGPSAAADDPSEGPPP